MTTKNGEETQSEMSAIVPEIRLYQIRDWGVHFENDRSRDIKYPLMRCSFPTKQDGLGRGRILRMPNGEAILGCFIQIVLLCAKRRAPRAGWLTEDGTPVGLPLSTGDISQMIGYSAGTVSQTLSLCASPSEPRPGRIDWIIDHGIWSQTGQNPLNIPTLPSAAGLQRDHAPVMVTQEERKEGRKEGGTCQPPPSSSTSGNGNGKGHGHGPKNVLDIKTQISAIDDHLKRLSSSQDSAKRNAPQIAGLKKRREELKIELIAL